MNARLLRVAIEYFHFHDRHDDDHCHRRCRDFQSMLADELTERSWHAVERWVSLEEKRSGAPSG